MSTLTRRTVTFGLLASACTLGSAGAGYASTRRATAFGTVVKLTAKGRSASQVEFALDASFHSIRSVEDAFSLFNPKSELSRFNRAGSLRNPSSMFVDLTQRASEVWRLTAGAFDPSVQPLWRLWAAAGGAQVEPEAIALVRRRVGFEHLRIDSSRITSQLPGLELSLNGVAQGYAADLVATVMHEHDIESAHIDTGELGSAGNLPIDENMTGIQNPRDPAKFIGTIAAAKRFLATSGDYATAFSKDFSAHHIFDPRTGFSPTELSAVSVLAPTGALADALATAFMVTGRVKALILANMIEGVDALLISKSGDVSMTPGMRRVFRPV